MARPSPTVWRTLAMVASMKCCAVQVGLAPQMFESEVAQDVRARLGVAHFGMELHRPHLSLGCFDGGHRTGRAGHQVEAGGQFYRFIAVRHPDGKFCGEAFEKTRAVLDFDVGMAVLAFVGGAHFAAESVHHELQSVADAQHGQAQLRARADRRAERRRHTPTTGRRKE